jgi:hypothetical protein
VQFVTPGCPSWLSPLHVRSCEKISSIAKETNRFFMDCPSVK